MANFIKKVISFFSGNESNISTPDEINRSIRVRELYLKGMDFEKRGHFEDAINCFNESIENGFNDEPYIYQFRGICFQKLDRHLPAIKDFTNSISMDSGNWANYYYRSNSFKEVGDFKNQFSDIQKTRILLSEKRKMTEYEEKIFTQLGIELERSDRDVDHHEILKSTRNKLEDLLETARMEFSKPGEKIPPKNSYDSSYEELLVKATELCKEGNNTLALAYLDYAIEKNSFDSRALSVRAFCLQGLGYHLDSIDDFTKALELSPEDPNYHFGRGNSYVAMKNYSAAVKDADKAIQYASLNNPLFEHYNIAAKENGFSSALNLYQMSTFSWSRQDEESKYEKLFQDALKNGNATAQEIFKGRLEKIRGEMEGLLKRRK